VSISLGNLFRDETSGTNVVHPGSLGLGFAQGVSSFLTLNEFKLECGFFVSGDEERWAKGGISKGSGVYTPTGARDKS
jgi:hypothetical protein